MRKWGGKIFPEGLSEVYTVLIILEGALEYFLGMPRRIAPCARETDKQQAAGEQP